MTSGTICGIKIHHLAYILTVVLFLREVVDAILGFTYNILLLVGAFVTTMVLLIALAALTNHGVGIYRVFFVFYFILLISTFLSLLIGLVILRTGRAAADFGYERGYVSPSNRWGQFIETEHEFWRVYIYGGFAFFIIELLYAWVMFKAYYYSKARNESRQAARSHQQSGNLPAHFSFSMSGQQPPANPNFAEAPPRYTEGKEYYPPPNLSAYSPLKTQTDV